MKINNLPSFSKVLSDSWQIYYSSLTKILPIAFISGLLHTIIMVFYPPPEYSSTMSLVELKKIIFSKGFSAELIFTLFNVVFYCILLYLCNQQANKTEIKYGEAIFTAIKKSFIYLPISALRLAMVLWVLLFIDHKNLLPILMITWLIPCIYLLIMLYFAVINVMLGNNSIIIAIKNSYQMVSGNWWWVFSRVIICLVLSSLAAIFITSIAEPLLAFILSIIYSTEWANTAGVRASTMVLVTMLTMSWMVAVDLVLYRSLRK